MGRILEIYNERVSLGELEADNAQGAAAARLDRLSETLGSKRPYRPKLFSVFSENLVPQGVYLFGRVGRGKTMLMDLFFEGTHFAPKRRLHFHEFMADVHERIARGRATTDGDPISFVATEIAADAGLLCFDELSVTDIADAMILGRLFKGLFERGLVMVATANVPPGALYANGLNRQLFMPFIELIEEHMDVVELEAAKDFRLDKLAGRQLYFSPCDAAARACLDRHWARLTGHHSAGPAVLKVKGRNVTVPLASMGVARFAFSDLCEMPLSALDYLHISHAFHTLLIDNIPVLSPSRRNEARRLVNLIDTLYDNKVCLIASAEAEPNLLYPHGDGREYFERTASRLMEMRSEAYPARRSERRDARSASSICPSAAFRTTE